VIEATSMIDEKNTSHALRTPREKWRPYRARRHQG